MRKTMTCGRCGNPVRLKIDMVTCPTCNLAHPLDMARIQIALQAEMHGHIVDEHSFRADPNGLLIFNVKTAVETPVTPKRLQSA